MMKLVDLPYLFTNAQQAYKVLDGPIGRQILDEFEKLVFMPWSGTKTVSAS